MNVAGVQLALRTAGFNPGPADGAWGPLTQAAMDASQRSLGNDPPPWLIVAERELGVHEIAGAGSNKRVEEYFRHTSLGASDDSVPWCSAFANFCMDQAGYRGTGSAAAISWKSWGRPTDFKYGCVCVFSRTGGNHVAFGLAIDAGSIAILGGNQADSVCVEVVSRARLIATRWRKL